MKRKCKDIDITDRDLISRALYECIWEKLDRRDTVTLLSAYSGLKPKFIRNMIKDCGKPSMKNIIETIIDGIQSELINRSLSMKRIHYHDKTDPSSQKVRSIGIQDIKQQLFDYIAVEGLRPLLPRIGEYQCSSIKGRGQIYGIRIIHKWLQDPTTKYAAQFDIRKCYESINRDKLVAFLRKHVKNEHLLWLITILINTFRKGLSIGSYLSQFLCNLYLSQIYHEIAENMYRTRKHKNGVIERISLVKHELMFMDDLIILGTNAKDLHTAVTLVISKADEMGLHIKESWVVFKRKSSKYGTGQFIDIMGFRVYRDHITIRKRVFIRIRRSLKKTMTLIKTHKRIFLYLARRCLSYFGQIKNSDSLYIRKKYNVIKIKQICRMEVSNEQKRCNLLAETA